MSDERIVRDRIVDAVPSTYGQDAFNRILSERDSLQSRLQAAEADKTEWRDLYEELHVKLEAAEAWGQEAFESWQQELRQRQELQEALERSRVLLQRWLEMDSRYPTSLYDETRIFLHPQNEGSRT